MVYFEIIYSHHTSITTSNVSLKYKLKSRRNSSNYTEILKCRCNSSNYTEIVYKLKCRFNSSDYTEILKCRCNSKVIIQKY